MYLIAKPGTRYSIMEGIQAIDGSAFLSCRQLTSVVFPESLTSIGAEAFKNCTGLENILINLSEELAVDGTDMSRIGDNAFDGCVD